VPYTNTAKRTELTVVVFYKQSQIHKKDRHCHGVALRAVHELQILNFGGLFEFQNLQVKETRQQKQSGIKTAEMKQNKKNRLARPKKPKFNVKRSESSKASW
jgi:LmbE family N-acetylglucosaminyl deacetylase